MKTKLLILGAVVYYCAIILLAIWLGIYFNIASNWFIVYLIAAFFVVTIPTSVVFVVVFNDFIKKHLKLKKKPDYDINLLEHAVINQIESDLGDNDFAALSEMLQNLISGKYDNTEILYQYLGDTAQENLKEGLTVKRWNDE